MQEKLGKVRGNSPKKHLAQHAADLALADPHAVARVTSLSRLSVALDSDGCGRGRMAGRAVCNERKRVSSRSSRKLYRTKSALTDPQCVTAGCTERRSMSGSVQGGVAIEERQASWRSGRRPQARWRLGSPAAGSSSGEWHSCCVASGLSVVNRPRSRFLIAF